MNPFEKSLSQTASKQAGVENLRNPNEIIEFRYKQSYASRLAEFVTGIRPDDPRFAERLALDQKIFRKKYSLPARELKWEIPTEYERFLRERAEKNGVKIRDESDCGTFFEENSVGGVFFGERNEIGSTINRESLENYARSLSVLEHEFIHSQQAVFSPRMPIELREYEAYIAGVNPSFAKDPETAELLFSFLIGGSVLFWYREKNNERKSNEPEIKAVYEDPDYFLKNVDHIDEAVIKEYKKKLTKK